MIQRNLPALVIVVPLLAALIAPLLTRINPRVVWWWVTATLGATLVMAIQLLLRVENEGTVQYAMGGWPAPTGIEYAVDMLNAIVLVMIAAVSFLTSIWMARGLREEIREPKRPGYLTVFLLSTAGMMGIAITGDVFNLYVFLEIASITSYVLIGMGRRRKALYAGYSYLIIGSVGATFILLGIGHLYMKTGTLAIADLAQRVPEMYDDTVIRTAFAFFTIGFAIKMALFPLHGWQPGAYTEAPAAASIFIAATSTKVSAYGLYRISFTVYGTDFLDDVLPVFRDAILLMASAAIVLGPLIAIRQKDLKRLLAYSSVGQIGYVVLGIVLLNQDGVTGGIVHFWNHAAAKGALFCVAGALVFCTGASRVDDLAGLGRRARWTAVTVTIAGCSMVGVPLTAGFLSKYYLAVGAFDAGRWFVVPVLLASSLFTAVYVWRIVSLVWFAPADDEAKIGDDVPWTMRLPGLVLAAACIVFGVTSTGVDFARKAAEALLP